MIQTLSILAALRESGATVGLPTSGFPRSPSSVGENGKAWGGHQKPIEIPRRPCYKPCAMRKLRGTRASGLNRLGPRELRFELRVDFVARAGSLPRLFQVVGRRLRHGAGWSSIRRVGGRLGYVCCFRNHYGNVRRGNVVVHYPRPSTVAASGRGQARRRRWFSRSAKPV